MKNLNVIGATMQICLASGVKAIAVRNIGGVVTDEQRGAKMINRILERLEEESDFFGGEPMGSLQKMFYCKGVEKAKEIVQEVAKEYKAPIRCLTCARYTDADTIDNTCYLCCKGIEDNYLAKEGE